MNKNTKSVKLTILLVSCLTIMSIVTISPSLPDMNVEFLGIENSEFLVKMILTIPALFIALISPIAGILIDKYGRLRLLWAALVLYGVAGSSGYLLDNIYVILISRALLGIAVGTTMTIAVTLIADYFEGLERQKFIGLQIAFMSLGGILFIGLGGVLADINWRTPFLIYLLSIVILPFAVKFLYEPELKQVKQTQMASKKSPPIIWLLFFNVMFMWILFFLIPVQVPFHLKAIGVEQNALIGAAIAMSTAFSAVSAILYSKTKNRFSFYTIFALGYVLMGIGYWVLSTSDSYSTVVLSMILAGLGMGMMIPNTNMWVMNIAPIDIRGREIGRLTTFWFLGQFLSPIILLPLTNSYSISATFGYAAVFIFFLAILFFVLQITSNLRKAT